jgi:hypothetical protein
MIMLLSAQQMLAKRRDPALAPTQPLTGRSTTRRLDSSYPDRALGRDIAYRVERLPMGMMSTLGIIWRDFFVGYLAPLDTRSKTIPAQRQERLICSEVSSIIALVFPGTGRHCSLFLIIYVVGPSHSS